MPSDTSLPEHINDSLASWNDHAGSCTSYDEDTPLSKQPISATADEAVSPANRFFASLPGVLITCVVCCLLWGSAFPCIKIGYELFNIAATDTASQMLFAGARFTISGLMVITGMSIAGKRFLHPERTDLRAVLLLSLFQTILQYICFYQGLSKASGVTSSIVTASSNFLAIIFAALLFRTERLTTRKVIGCLAGFGGVVAINLGGQQTGLTFTLGGEGLILGSAIAGAMSTCLIGIFGKKHNPVMLSGWQFLVGGLVLTVWAIAAGGHLAPPQPLPALCLLVYMGFISAMAYSLWSRLLAVNPVSRVSVFGFLNPVFGFLLSALLLGEGGLIAPGVAALALALVCGGIVIVNLPGRTAAPRIPNKA